MCAEAKILVSDIYCSLPVLRLGFACRNPQTSVYQEIKMLKTLKPLIKIGLVTAQLCTLPSELDLKVSGLVVDSQKRFYMPWLWRKKGYVQQSGFDNRATRWHTLMSKNNLGKYL